MTMNTDTRNLKDADKARERFNDYSMGVLMLIIGVNAITDANFKDVWHRVSFYEKVCGAMYSVVDDDDRVVPAPVTRDELAAWIGFRVNANPMTTAQFRNHMWKLHTQSN